jgi:tRNA-dihydrouridine synthase B
MQIGRRTFAAKVVLAPMAGVTDAPFRGLCASFGLELAISEMVSSNPDLRRRCARARWAPGAPGGFRWVQIVGADPQAMADTARMLEAEGVDCIDINMGCPARKVCRRAAGSALLRDERLVERILRAVVAAVAVPVTLKTRTGWSPEHRNGPVIARIAEAAGIAAISVHGRTRACGFAGDAEFGTLAEIRRAVTIPVIANGDIASPERAAAVLEQTGADAVMIGRAALGAPRLPAAIDARLRALPWRAPQPAARAACVLAHLRALHAHHGDFLGVRIARKHLRWYFGRDPHRAADLAQALRAGTPQAQFEAVGELLAGPRAMERAARG